MRWRARSVAALVLAVLIPGATRAAGPVRARFQMEPAAAAAGDTVLLRFAVEDSGGRRVRFLQYVHERPMHLIVVSRDLATFAHIHPELAFDDAYEVRHAFPRGGGYRLFADYAPPGAGTQVDRFDVEVAGPAGPQHPLVVDRTFEHTAGGVIVSLAFASEPRANADLAITATFRDSASGAPVTDLQLYLGALAHLILVSEDLRDFVHAHPLETGEVADPSRDPAAHIHDPAQLAARLVGPSPSVIHAVTSLPQAGRYKLWLQFQRGGEVFTVPFVFAAAAPAARAVRPAAIPDSAVRVVVSAAGYSPARVELRRGEPVTLAFSRPTAGNCGGEVVIPDLGIRRDLPVGGTTLVRLTPERSGEFPFHCGMGMYQGLIVVR